MWTKICITKAAYIKGSILTARSSLIDADVAFERVVPLLELNKASFASTPQLAYWAEQLLGEIALTRTHQDMSDGGNSATAAFREWAQLASHGTQPSPPAYAHARGPKNRLFHWRAYYQHLSSLVQNSIPDDPSHLRANLVPELRRVEAAYENELMRRIQFPKATDSNQIVEEWVEQVIRNWETLCGSRWLESDLGDGGRNSIGRNVIEILYRAAMKTFQSTLILRRLFEVHKSLADFDLAYKALDTYLELIDRGRASAAKAGQPSGDQDDDETAVLTVAEGIEGLCSFGHQGHAEKAYNLCCKLETLMPEIDPDALLLASNNLQVNGSSDGNPATVLRLSPESRQLVQRALGIGKAHWARWTPVNEKRTTLQQEAVSHLRLATSQPLSNMQKLRSTYALGLLLAETREIDTAIDLVKTALAQEIPPEADRRLAQQRLIPTWHLLSLLLTSREDYDTATQGCMAAFEQFPTDVLFGSGKGRSVSKQKNIEKPEEMGLVDDMECDELQKIVEVRLTELALAELEQGPEHAVNTSDDLLVLFSRLFGHLGVAAEEKPQQKALQPPKSSAGTVKSFRGSLFHRKKVPPSDDVVSERPNGAASIKTDTTRPPTQATQAPTIRVTDEDEKPSPQKHHLFRHSRESSRHEKAKSSQSAVDAKKQHSSPKRLLRSASRDRKTPAPAPSVNSSRQSFETSQQTPRSSTGTAETAPPHLSTILSADERTRPSTPPATKVNNTDSESTPTAKAPQPSIPHNLDSRTDFSALSRDTTQLQQQNDSVLAPPGSGPITRFPRGAAQQHALTILVKIWLVIAKLYRRASMFEDSREATDEAAKSALKVETLVAAVESSARAFADPGWGGCGKSSDEVWADVYCERGECALAMAMARAELDEKEAQKNTPYHTNIPHAHQQEQQTPNQVDSEGVRDAVDYFEQCLMYFPNHPGAIVSLSNVLLDYYERKVELGRKVDDGKAKAEIKRAQSLGHGLGRGIQIGRAGQRGLRTGSSRLLRRFSRRDKRILRIKPRPKQPSSLPRRNWFQPIFASNTRRRPQEDTRELESSCCERQSLRSLVDLDEVGEWMG